MSFMDEAFKTPAPAGDTRQGGAHARRGRTAAAAIGLVACAVAAGCETISQDFGELADNIMPTSPQQAGLMMVNKNDADERREGTTLIGNSVFGGAPPYLAAYREYVQHDDDPLVKAAAIRALARHGTPDDALLISPHLGDSNEQVRWEAAKGLQRLHNPAVVPDLLEVARNIEEKSDVRVAAAIALGQYPEDRVFRGLVGRLDERELSVNRAAQQSLVTLTGQDFGLNSVEWLRWYNSEQGSAFAGQLEYRYPTYTRKEGFWEKVAFWSSNVWEQPAPPAGLRSGDESRTYVDSGEPASAPSDSATTSPEP